MSQRGYEVECKRRHQRNARPQYVKGDAVRLHDGRVVTLTRVVVRDWNTEYWVGAERLGHRAIAHREKMR